MTPDHAQKSAAPRCAPSVHWLPSTLKKKRRRGVTRSTLGKVSMNETSQAQFSPAGAPPRKNVRPVGRPARSPDILAAAGAMIRERRESQGKSLRQLADLTDRSHGYIGDVERGKCSICFDLAARLAVVLDLDLAEILCAFRVVPEHAAARFFDVDRMRAALAGEQR